MYYSISDVKACLLSFAQKPAGKTALLEGSESQTTQNGLAYNECDSRQK